MVILAIESSHDDTSLALMKDGEPIWMETITQIEVHKKYGGTVPEIASRLHVKNIGILIEKLKRQIDLKQIDQVAYTKKPGLIGSLHVGYVVANTISRMLNKPILPLNHLEGHFFSAFINEEEIKFPIVGLIVSGGHSQLIYYKNFYNSKVVGETLDDAVGEVYDKIARKLNLDFPGGPIIDKIWQENKSIYKTIYTLPKTKNFLDFSFSGLKTHVINLINNDMNRKIQINVNKYATEFQNTVIEYLRQHMDLAIKNFHPKCVVLAGGVSANSGIRQMFESLNIKTYIPKLEYTTDNAMMIAELAYEKIRNRN